MAENPAALSQAVQRALTEALGSIQRQLAEVQGSFEQVKKALEAAAGEGSTDRTVALLPPLMHMQASGAALAASIEAVLRFVGASAQWTGIPAVGMPVAAPAPAAARHAPVAEAPPPEPAPAATMSGVAPSLIAIFRSAPPAANARMICGSRNFAASRYGVEPTSVAGKLKSVVSRRSGVPFVMRIFGSAPRAMSALTRFRSLLSTAACSAV